MTLISEEKIKNLKKAGKTVLNFLYYFLIIPAFFHGLYKIGEWIFTPKSKLIKDFRNFEQTKTPNSVRLYKGKLPGRNTKHFFKKNEKDGTWIAKIQPNKGTFNELIVGEPFRIMLGESGSPKYRAMIDDDGRIYSISKFLENLEQFFDDGTRENQSYNEYIEKYQQFKEVENFHYMLAVCLLFGKTDPHTGNWGIFVEENRKKAVTLDHEETLTKIGGWHLYQYLYKCGHRKEVIVSEKFINECKQVINSFDDNYQTIEEACKNGITASKQIVGFFKQSDVMPIEKVMKILKYNREQLQNLCHHIQCELAIASNDPKKLQKHSAKFTKKYKNFGVMSLQN
jgi:hypothetical protein